MLTGERRQRLIFSTSTDIWHSYLYITGRSKEIINKGGEVISPFEVEEAIMTVAKDRVKVFFLCHHYLCFVSDVDRRRH